MKNENNYDNIIELIAGGYLTKAVKLLIEVLGELLNCDDVEELFLSSIALSRELHSLNKGIIEGRISWKQANREKNEITMRLLDILQQIKG